MHQQAVTSREWNPRINPFLVFLVWLLTNSAVGLLIWSYDKGIDLTDEGFYLLNYRYPERYLQSFTLFHQVVAKLLGWRDGSVKAYRYAALLLHVVSTASFVIGLGLWLRSHTGSVLAAITRPLSWWLGLSGYVLLTTLFAYAVSPRTLSYNTLTSCLLLLVAGSTLLALRHNQTSWQRCAWMMAAGICLGVELLVKSSTALLLFTATAVLYGWEVRQSLVTGWLSMVVGVMLVLLWFSIRVQPLGAWWQAYTGELTMLHGTSYHVADLLSKYLLGGWEALRIFVYPLSFGVAILLALAYWWRDPGSNLVRLGLTVAVSATFVGWAYYQVRRLQLYKTAELNGDLTLPVWLALILLWVAVGVLAAEGPMSEEHRRLIRQHRGVGLWLLALPLLATAGTFNNPIFNLLFDLAPWMATAYVTVWLLPKPTRMPKGVWTTAASLPALFMSEQLYWGVVRAPYLQVAPMPDQRILLRAPGMHEDELRVDAPTAQFVTQTLRVLERGNYHPGDAILALYDLPGLVYILGGYSPGTAWYFMGLDSRNRLAWERAQPIEHPRLFVLVNGPIGEEMKASLAQTAGAFPAQYRYLGRVPNAYARNVYHWRFKQNYVDIYVSQPKLAGVRKGGF